MDQAGYKWSIQARGAEWVWTIRSGEGAPVDCGAAPTRAQAAACVVRALVRGMTPVEAPRTLAA